MPLFQKHALQVKMVKADSDTPEATAKPAVDLQEINEIAQDQVVNAAIAVGGAVVAVKALNIFGEIVLHIAKTKIK